MKACNKIRETNQVNITMSLCSVHHSALLCG
jgi:hypothetical protein